MIISLKIWGLSTLFIIWIDTKYFSDEVKNEVNNKYHK